MQTLLDRAVELARHSRRDTNSALLGSAGPYAQVSITRVDNFTANIVFTSLANNGITFLMGDGGTADLNVNGAYTLGAVTETGLSGFTPTFVGNSPGQVDGFGVFNLSLDNFDGYGDSANSVSLQITNATGLWTPDAAVLTNNANGANAAIHAFCVHSSLQCRRRGAGHRFCGEWRDQQRGSGTREPPIARLGSCRVRVLASSATTIT